jgi:ribonuclease P protein component
MKVINRIKSNEEFGITVKKGKTLKAPSYVVHFVKTERNICRIGISVSKKIGNAVTRNRVKRQIRAMCDSLIKYNDHTFDIVIVAKAEFLNQSFDSNKQALNKLLSEIGITK